MEPVLSITYILIIDKKNINIQTSVWSGWNTQVELNVIVKNTLEAISEAYKCDKITLEDYNEMLSVIQNLNDYFIDTYNYYKVLAITSMLSVLIAGRIF